MSMTWPSLALGLIAPADLTAPPAVPTTATPIEHLIVVVGENRTFDNLFGVYQPRRGQTVDNLLSKGIVRADGQPGTRFALAAQSTARAEGAYSPTPPRTGLYPALPTLYAGGAKGQPHQIRDLRFPETLPNGPFQITRHVSYGAHTGDPTHRFFQMWQQIDGGRQDLFAWVAESVGAGPSNDWKPQYGQLRQGGVALGFYNMATGDAPTFKRLADDFTIADNYHQSVMGGTTPNYFALATGDVAVYNEAGKLAKPPAKRIENPDAAPGTNNWYIEDGYSGGSYVGCADPQQPGVAGIRAFLASLPYKPWRDGNCEPGAYYLVNNLDPAYEANGKPRPLGPDEYTVPPQTMPSIGDAMTAGGVSWKWYSGGRADGHPVRDYCHTCDALTQFTSTMTGPDRARLQDLGQFYADVKDAKTFPAVSIIAPYDSVSGHPGYSIEPAFDHLVQDVVDRVRANPALWAKTAILITFDEGGGYYDSGYVQFIDFFGDGTRVPLVAVSPFAKGGRVDHTYYDHASIIKFIRRNWGLPALSARSRDNLPNPVTDPKAPYVPQNRPAIGDLMNLFTFPAKPTAPAPAKRP
jgi:phospholipase C